MGDFIQLNGKKYKVASLGEDSFQNIWDRQKTYEEGLTGLTIIQDFTNSGREPRRWAYTLRVFISDPWPDNEWGVWSDLLDAYRQPYVEFIEHDETTTHEVGLRFQLLPIPRVPANISGACHGVFFVNIDMVKVYR